MANPIFGGRGLCNKTYCETACKGQGKEVMDISLLVLKAVL